MNIKDKIKIYWNYFKYILEHKKNVFIECFKMKMFIHAFTHDLSKFLPSEFFAYADKFFSGDYAYRYFEVENNFTKAWNFHQKRNKHHWNYWISVDSKGKLSPVEMPMKYVKQMIVDWKAMGRKFGDTAEQYFYKNEDNFILHTNTRDKIMVVFGWEDN